MVKDRAATGDGPSGNEAPSHSDNTPPRFPFVGKIQCVALYKGALNLARKISGVTRVIRRKMAETPLQPCGDLSKES